MTRYGDIARVINGLGSPHGSIELHTGLFIFPAQWLYGLLRALPGDEFLLSPSCTRIGALSGRRRLAGARRNLRGLAPATGVRPAPDFTVRISAVSGGAFDRAQ